MFLVISEHISHSSQQNNFQDFVGQKISYFKKGFLNYFAFTRKNSRIFPNFRYLSALLGATFLLYSCDPPEDLKGTDGPKWKHIAVGNKHTLAINNLGKLYAWGKNTQGQLGDGKFAQRSKPTKIGNYTDWAAIAAGGEHSLGLKKDGRLYAWGQNTKGQLGDGSTKNRDDPLKVNRDTDWAAIAAGGEHSLGLKKDGRLYAWGGKWSGAIGPR